MDSSWNGLQEALFINFEGLGSRVEILSQYQWLQIYDNLDQEESLKS